MEWVVALATIVGPVAAVGITLWYQNRDRAFQRKLSVFTTMMRWRRHPLSVDYVGALNLVPVEFDNKPEVVERYKALIDVFDDHAWNADDREARARVATRAETAATQLLSAMARVLGTRTDSIDIMRGAYAPTGWANDEELNRATRVLLRLVLSGERPLAVEVRQPADHQEPVGGQEETHQDDMTQAILDALRSSGPFATEKGSGS